ncbi:MAG: hypothetical protein DRH70_10045 [Candidatus Coatesbacteria bacterium]|nr:MAG: hypothetical protein DRH70_10045 [Candidatus Coatesbacteria bacterium]
MYNNIQKIFLGVPPSESRKALAHFVTKNLGHFDKYVVPCAGTFAAIQTIVNAGVSPKQIIASDISLYSSTLGYFLSNKPIDELGVKFKKPELQFLVEYSKNNELRKAASILFGIKYAQLSKDKTYFAQSFREELYKNSDVYLSQLEDELKQLKKKIGGLSYTIKDVFVEIFDHADDERTFMFINPPAYRGGYSKMFGISDTIGWNEPRIKEFDPALRFDLLNTIRNIKATAIVYHNVPDISEEKYTRGVEFVNKLFAKAYSEKRIDYLLINKEIDKDSLLLKRPYSEVKRLDIPLFSDDDLLNKYTKVSIVPITREVAEYYRNLFVHRLTAKAGGEQHYLMLLDGKIFTVFGLKFDKATKDGHNYIYETYGITVPSKKWLRFNRLFMRLLVCKDFKRDILALHRYYKNIDLADIEGVKTTCISLHPEVRLNRGLLKLVERKRLPDGTYYLQYYAPFNDKTYKQNIVEYIDEHNRLKRLRENGKTS